MAKKVSNYKGRNPGKAKKERVSKICPVCGASIKMVSVKEMNFRFENANPNAPQYYWVCSHYPECDTYCPADNRTKKPLGTLAGPTLRHKRMVLHHWEGAMVRSHICTREEFRMMCGYYVGLSNPSVVHVRNMTELQCDAIIDHLLREYKNNPKVHEMVDAAPASTMWRMAHGVDGRHKHGTKYDENGKVIAYGKETEQEEVLRKLRETAYQKFSARF